MSDTYYGYSEADVEEAVQYILVMQDLPGVSMSEIKEHLGPDLFNAAKLYMSNEGVTPGMNAIPDYYYPEDGQRMDPASLQFWIDSVNKGYYEDDVLPETVKIIDEDGRYRTVTLEELGIKVDPDGTGPDSIQPLYDQFEYKITGDYILLGPNDPAPEGESYTRVDENGVVIESTGLIGYPVGTLLADDGSIMATNVKYDETGKYLVDKWGRKIDVAKLDYYQDLDLLPAIDANGKRVYIDQMDGLFIKKVNENLKEK